MTHKTRIPARQRTSLKLDRTHSRHTVLLDFASATALQYSQAAAEHITGLSVPASVVARRALIVYALHIQQQARNQEAGAAMAERRALKAAADGARAAHPLYSLVTEQQAQSEALARVRALADVPHGELLPGFLDCLHGPEVMAASAAGSARLEQRVAELVDSIASSRWGRLRGIQTSTSDLNTLPASQQP